MLAILHLVSANRKILDNIYIFLLLQICSLYTAATTLVTKFAAMLLKLEPSKFNFCRTTETPTTSNKRKKEPKKLKILVLLNQAALSKR